MPFINRNTHINMNKIEDLYEENPDTLINIIVSFLKGRVSIIKETKEPTLSAEIIQENTRTKILYYLLGKKIIALSFPDADSGQHGASATTISSALHLSKGSADGLFYNLRNERIIEEMGKKGREVLYHIPNHKVLDVVQSLKPNDK